MGTKKKKENTEQENTIENTEQENTIESIDGESVPCAEDESENDNEETE